MKWFIQSILLLLTVTVFSQTKSFSKVIELTSKADTVYFTADNSGCFDSYILVVKMCKQKSGDRKLIMRSKMRNEEKIISAKHYKAFIKNYERAVNHFSTIDKGKCTSITEFELMCRNKSGNINSTKFKNTTCDAEFNPEMFLQDLIRSSEGIGK